MSRIQNSRERELDRLVASSRQHHELARRRPGLSAISHYEEAYGSGCDYEEDALPERPEDYQQTEADGYTYYNSTDRVVNLELFFIHYVPRGTRSVDGRTVIIMSVKKKVKKSKSREREARPAYVSRRVLDMVDTRRETDSLGENRKE